MKVMKGVKGVGPYAAENVLKLLGRYDGLALDSWTRAKFFSDRKKFCSRPGIKRQTVVAAQKFEHVLGSVRTDPFDALHYFHEVNGRQRALEPPFYIDSRLGR